MTGKFFLCRTTTPSTAMGCVQAVVEDVKGNKVILALFSYSVEAKNESDFESVLPLGTVMIVKDPVFKNIFDDATDTPVVGVVAENPGDVELLSPKRMAALFPGKICIRI